MTKHEADVIGGLNMTDQISNEAYKQIMIVAQDENEVGDVLDNIRADIEKIAECEMKIDEKWALGLKYSLQIIDNYRNEVGK